MGRRMSGSVLLLITLALSLIVGDVLVLAAQDPPTPKPTPQPETPQTQPTKPQSSKKRTRDKVQTATATGDQTAMPGQTTPAQPGQEQTMTPAQTRATAPTEQTDLPGTYAGTFNCDALGLTGDTTLTITGNQFTTADGKTGRIVASTTGGYTAVALQTGDVATGATATKGATATTPTIVSLRARKSGDRLTLTSVPGATMQCSFMPARNVAKGRRSRQRTPAATGTEVSNPSAAPTPTTPAQPMPEPSQTPSPTPSPAPTPEPAPTPTPEPTPEPAPTPSPGPSPTPSGSPTPAPEPTATPSPTPTPSPARPRG